MRLDNYNIVAPSIFTNESFSEMEVLGALALQWMDHDYYREISIESAFALLIAIIKTRQFALFIKDNIPIGYVIWAFMNEETEKDYLDNSGEVERFIGCNNGNALWILSIFAEKKFTSEVVHLMREYVFPEHHAKSLYHRGQQRGFRIMDFYGKRYNK